MKAFLRHEAPVRGKGIEKLAKYPLYIMGAGAIGSNLVVTLAKQGFESIRIFDFDRVEEHNLGTQAYNVDDVGSSKAEALTNLVFNCSGVEIFPYTKRVAEPLLHNLIGGITTYGGLIVDCFDNSESRQALFNWSKNRNVNCLHAGFNGPYAEIKWNENYIVPTNEGEDICEYPLARNLVTLTVSVLAETIVNFVISQEKSNYSITFNDLVITKDEV